MRGEVDVDDLAGVGVEDGDEVLQIGCVLVFVFVFVGRKGIGRGMDGTHERVGVEVLVCPEAGEHERLLDTLARREALVAADRAQGSDQKLAYGGGVFGETWVIGSNATATDAIVKVKKKVCYSS